MADNRKILRGVALGLQIAAILAYFLPSVFAAFSGGRVGVPWLIFGVINVAVFCAIFYRVSGVTWRFVVGIILTVCTAFWCLGLLIFIAVLSLIAGLYEWSGLGINLFVYVFFSLASAIFAVCAPKPRED